MGEPVKRRKKRSAEEVIAAIHGSGGIKATIGRRLTVDRHRVDHYLAIYPSVAQAYKNEVDTIGDVVETVILEAIQAKDVETAKWYAKNKLRNRGYSERVEHTGEDGKPIRFIVEVPKKEETAEAWVQQYQKELTYQPPEE